MWLVTRDDGVPSRRHVVGLALATCVGGLAGCTSGGENGETDSEATAATSPASTTDTGGAAGTDRTDSTPTPGAGDIVWRRTLDGAIDSRPTLAGDRLVVGTGSGTVAALSTDDGRQQWTEEAETAIHGSPVVAEGTALAVSGDVEHQVVTAFDVADGDRQWEFAPNEWLLAVLGVRDGTVYVATADDLRETSGQVLYARSLADGSREWATEVGDNKGGIVTDDAVYVPSVRAVDAVGRDGSHRWSYEGDEYQFGTLAVAGDTVVFVTSESWDSHTVRGVDAATGEEQWTFSPSWRAYTTHAAGDRLFVGGEKVARLDPASGEVVWRADQRAALYRAVVDDGRLYVGTREAAALAADDGRVEWRRAIDGERAFVAGLESGRLLLHKSASEDAPNHHVLALEPGTGERAWEFAADRELTRLTVGAERLYCGTARDLLALSV